MQVGIRLGGLLVMGNLPTTPGLLASWLTCAVITKETDSPRRARLCDPQVSSGHFKKTLFMPHPDCMTCRSVLARAGMECMFFTAALLVLCFASLPKAALTTHQCFGHRCRAITKASLSHTLPALQGDWGDARSLGS